jgi:predicted lipoprotein with Yx(FWY)xxD motif
MYMKLLPRFILCAMSIAFFFPAFAADKLLTTKNGMTVYTFDKDGAGTSNCNGGCTVTWPPVSADSINASSDITTINRKDGSKQAAYKNQPIYTYIADKKAGDKTGEGVGGVWHSVTPGKAPAKKASTNSNTEY